MKQSLAGVRIVDLTRGMSGAVATWLLAEQGADVVMIEDADPPEARASAGFATWRRSKRSAVLDQRGSSGRDSLWNLVETADVVVHDLQPDEARALGLGASDIRARAPQVVLCVISPYPIDGPAAGRAGSELLIQAASGAMSEVATYRAGPAFMRLPVASWAAALLAASGIMARLWARERTGTGGVAHTSLFDGMLAGLTTVWSAAESPTDNLRMKSGNPVVRPMTGLFMFQCMDGLWLHTTVGCTEHPLVLETLADLSYPPVILPPGHAPSDDEVRALREVFARHPSRTWIDELRSGDVPVALVEELGSVFRDEQVKINGYVAQVRDPVWGACVQAGTPYRSDPPAAIRLPAPRIGEHTEQVVRSGWLDEAPRPPLPPQERDTLEYPLQGVKVLDFGTYIAGPLGTQLLADLGADVIKIERLGGDPSRHNEQMFVGSQRGKRSIAIDLANPRGKRVLERLVRWADVIHHNMREGATARLGLDYETVRQLNPAVVYSRVNAYGHSGPKSGLPGYDPIAFAASGWGIASVPAGKKPMWYRMAPMDGLTAMTSAFATLLGLYAARRDARPTEVVTSMLGVAAMLNSETLLCGSSDVTAPLPTVNENQTGLSADYRIYELSDGWMALDARGAEARSRLHDWAGSAEERQIERVVAGERTVANVLATLGALDVPVEPVRTSFETGFLANSDWACKTLTTKHLVYGVMRLPGSYWSFDDLRSGSHRPPPTLGEHTREVLAQLGFSSDEITELLSSKVAIETALVQP